MTFSLLACLFLFVSSAMAAAAPVAAAAPASAAPKADEPREWVEKEKVVLELERQALNRELENLEREKKEWVLTQRAQVLARQLYRWDPVELPFELQRRDGLNRIISEHFASFLNGEGGGGKTGKLLLLKIRVDKEGRVTEVAVEKSELPENVEKKVAALAKKLDFGSLSGPLEPFEYRFPLVIQR